MMTKTRYAIRRNKGKKLLHEYLEQLSFKLKEKISAEYLLDLEITDEYEEAFHKGWKLYKEGKEPYFQKKWKNHEMDDLHTLLEKVRRKLPDGKVVLLWKDYEYCGAVSLSHKVILKYAKNLISLDGEDLKVLSEEKNNGMLLEYCTDWYPNSSELVYILTIWGKEWAEVFTEPGRPTPL